MTIPKLARAACAALIVLFAAPSLIHAQPDSTDTRLRVFLDCERGSCDRNFFITEMPYVIWTQDRLDADVHLLVTRLNTGSGGREFTLQFIGQRRLASTLDTLVTSVPPNTSDDVQRREVSRMIQIGLLGRAARVRTPRRYLDRVRVGYDQPTNVAASAQDVTSDGWNLWVYRADVSANGQAESRSSQYEVRGGFSARRITEKWKLDLDLDNEYRARNFKLSDSSTRTFILRSGDVSANVVRSVSEHWSIGTRANVGLSEFRNQDMFGSLDVSAEYNLFPWREATSRQLVALVALGGRYFDYREVTLFDQTSETRPILRGIIAGESRQAWGSVDGSLRYTQYLHDRERYNLSFDGRTSIRITRGLSVDFRGSASKVQDQLFLERGEVTDDEVLTRQRALATAYRLSGSVGLSFTFGSIYNNIVNPRLNRLGGGGGGGGGGG